MNPIQEAKLKEQIEDILIQLITDGKNVVTPETIGKSAVAARSIIAIVKKEI